MATATLPVSALAPYSPPEGLSVRDAFAHARDHIGKLTKNSVTLRQSLEKAGHTMHRFAFTGTQTVIATGTGAALGFANGLYGGEKGYAAILSAPVDVGVGIVGHIGGLVASYVGKDSMEPGHLTVTDWASEVLHTVGDAGLAAATYRFAHGKGLARAQAKAAEKGAGAPAPGPAPNGARGGAVYTVPSSPPR